MKNNGNLYTADEGNFIVRKSDGFVMGTQIDLGSSDSIDNYEEKSYTEKEYDDFCKKYGIKLDKSEDNLNKDEQNNK